MITSSLISDILIADEVFIATALLHRENPDRIDFTLTEIVNRAARENLHGDLRPGLRVHASLHCVANKPPNPGRYRMLYATGVKTRRLVLSDDDIHPARRGKIFPESASVPPNYRELIEWAKRRYQQRGAPKEKWLGAILEMRGIGRDLWRGEDPDAYVRELRREWE